MKKIQFAFVAVALILSSCKTQNKKAELVGKWQAVSLENTKLKEMMDMQTAFLDTFGKNNTDEQNIAIYGFSNLDSARDFLRQEMVDYMAMQEHAVKNTWFDFRKDGIVIMNFSGQVDSSKWEINNEGTLVLDETKTAESTEKLQLEILSLTDTMLKLQMSEQGMSSIVIFKPADK